MIDYYARNNRFNKHSDVFIYSAELATCSLFFSFIKNFALNKLSLRFIIFFMLPHQVDFMVMNIIFFYLEEREAKEMFQGMTEVKKRTHFKY